MNVQRSRGAWASEIVSRGLFRSGEFSFAEIDETIDFRKRYFQFLLTDCPCVQIISPRSHLWLICNTLRTAFECHAEEEGFLLAFFDQTTGAFNVKLKDVLRAVPPIWQVVREDICFATRDLRLGFRLEVNYFDWEQRSVPEGLFECSLWGFESPAPELHVKEWSSIDRLGVREID